MMIIIDHTGHLPEHIYWEGAGWYASRETGSHHHRRIITRKGSLDNIEPGFGSQFYLESVSTKAFVTPIGSERLKTPPGTKVRVRLHPSMNNMTKDVYIDDERAFGSVSIQEYYHYNQDGEYPSLVTEAP